MYDKVYNILSLWLLFFPVLAWTQDCTLTIQGRIKHGSTGMPVAYANIALNTGQQGTLSDSDGFFELRQICPQSQNLEISYLGCATRQMTFILSQDTVLDVVLEETEQALKTIVVVEDVGTATTQQKDAIGRANITENANKNLSNLLEQITGVSSLKTGAGIAKPIVHGLYGNRLAILNNGIAQAGQQWGNDHSPEIDPLAANSIAVVKGVAALEYQGNSLGSVVLVEPRRIRKRLGIHGEGSYFFESNGLGNGLNVQLEHHNKILSWKINGTLKKSGDKHGANYYLRNTGHEEANIAVQLEKKVSEKLDLEAYFSSFNTKIGVLRGAHVGNLTDLESALQRDVPFFTEEQFSYNIAAPHQAVNHHLLKTKGRYTFNDQQYLELTYAAQWNLRREFDVRRGGRTERPALSLNQWSHFVEAKYKHYFDHGLNFKAGIQATIVDNTNNSETGILPLIPDYLSYKSGAFVLLEQQARKWSWEFGGRYDFINQRVAAISRTLPRKIVRFQNNFHQGSVGGGIRYQPIDAIKLTCNLGYAARNPEINELYSNGLHQGVSGIEEGSVDLQPEHSLKATLGLEGRWKKRLKAEVLFFYQNVFDYIYLQPQDEFRLTIRGAFPVFKYTQTDAQIYGLDFSTTVNIVKNLSVNLKYSYLRGKDLSQGQPLINMPANSLSAGIMYELPKVGSFKQLKIGLHNKYVFRQTHLLPEQDFAMAPAAYNLLGLDISIQKKIKSVEMTFFAKVDNLLNAKYRDYLNRQRYFADDLGINVVVGCRLSF